MAKKLKDKIKMPAPKVEDVDFMDLDDEELAEEDMEEVSELDEEVDMGGAPRRIL